MNEREFTVGDKRFQLNKIGALKQFHIIRRLGPILGEVIPVAQKISAKLSVVGSEKSEAQKLDEIAKLIGPVMDGLSKLSDADTDTVLLGLCSAVEMHQKEHNCWAKVANGEVFMIQTLELNELLQIAGRAFLYNLKGFFPTANPNLAAQK